MSFKEQFPEFKDWENFMNKKLKKIIKEQTYANQEERS